MATASDGRKSLGHGRFLAWIEAEFEMSDAAALRFMQVAERYGSKSVIVTNLPPTVLYALSAPSTPEEVREKVEKDVAEGRKVAGDQLPSMASAAAQRHATGRRRLGWRPSGAMP